MISAVLMRTGPFEGQPESASGRLNRPDFPIAGIIPSVVSGAKVGISGEAGKQIGGYPGLRASERHHS
jgi:hypothetical protein